MERVWAFDFGVLLRLNGAAAAAGGPDEPVKSAIGIGCAPRNRWRDDKQLPVVAYKQAKHAFSVGRR